MSGTDGFHTYMRDVARRLFGEPTSIVNRESDWRYRAKGSLSINPKAGTWFDHEADKGGGVLDLISYETGRKNGEAVEWLREELGADIERPGEPEPDHVDKVAKILATCVHPAGTPAEAYLRNRGIEVEAWPDCIRYRPKAEAGYGALVMIATTADGEVLAVQQVFINSAGHKAQRTDGQPVKRTNKRVDGWASKAVARLPGEGSTIIAEGPENAVSIWAETGRPVLCTFGVANLHKVPVKRGDHVVLFPDGDDPRSTAAKQVHRAVKALVNRVGKNGSLRIVDTPPGADANDILRGEVGAALRDLIDNADVPRTKDVTSALAAESDWYSRVTAGERGQALGNLSNTLLALREDPAWQGVLAYDEMLRAVMVMRPLPKYDGTDAHGEFRPQPLTDEDTTAVQEWLQLAGLPTVAMSTTHQAVRKCAIERSFHPVRDWLESLKWDGVPRVMGGTSADGEVIEPWMSAYLGAENTPYIREIGRMFLVAMVARIMKPGCKADHMVILEGPQGARKSTACAILGGEWFSDALRDVGGKDANQHLSGRWLLEISELHAMSKADASVLKAFITRTDERYRRPHAREESHEPRQCVFIGTTNKQAYLRDETGGRRFWPVKVGTIDTDALQRDRAQLFAEAVRLFRAGSLWWPDGDFEAEHIAPQQEDRFEIDALEGRVREYLQGRPYTTVLDVATVAMNFETSRVSRAESNRIVAMLERLGWRRGSRGSGGVQKWVPNNTQP